LAAYVCYEALGDLRERKAPEESILGIVLASVSLLVMPLLAKAKRRVAGALRSGAMNADATQTLFCAYLSAILLGGLVLNAGWGIWWADAVAALLMVPFIVREGVDALRGETCRD
jgi:divalent metal cation (Fe/Co/Zn/Cd) transporter